jgi:hypothetical protein
MREEFVKNGQMVVQEKFDNEKIFKIIESVI